MSPEFKVLVELMALNANGLSVAASRMAETYLEALSRAPEKVQKAAFARAAADAFEMSANADYQARQLTRMSKPSKKNK